MPSEVVRDPLIPWQVEAIGFFLVSGLVEDGNGGGAGWHPAQARDLV